MTEETKQDQTLLEAAKEMDRLCMFTGTSALASRVVADLRAAIAREEAKPTTAATLAEWSAIQQAWAANERAQQAEAEAKWHREESARLSEDLRTARELLAYSKCAWQERAEKAEAELAERRREGLESEKSKPQQSHPMDGGEITVMLNRAGVRSIDSDLAPLANSKRIEWLIGEWKAERTLKESFRRDSQDVRNDMHAWNRRLGEVVPVADNPIDTVRAVIDEVHRLRTKVDLAKEALGGKS